MRTEEDFLGFLLCFKDKAPQPSQRLLLLTEIPCTRMKELGGRKREKNHHKVLRIPIILSEKDAPISRTESAQSPRLRACDTWSRKKTIFPLPMLEHRKNVRIFTLTRSSLLQCTHDRWRGPKGNWIRRTTSNGLIFRHLRKADSRFLTARQTDHPLELPL